MTAGVDLAAAVDDFLLLRRGLVIEVADTFLASCLGSGLVAAAVVEVRLLLRRSDLAAGTVFFDALVDPLLVLESPLLFDFFAVGFAENKSTFCFFLLEDDDAAALDDDDLLLLDLFFPLLSSDTATTEESSPSSSL